MTCTSPAFLSCTEYYYYYYYYYHYYYYYYYYLHVPSLLELHSLLLEACDLACLVRVRAGVRVR